MLQGLAKTGTDRAAVIAMLSTPRTMLLAGLVTVRVLASQPALADPFLVSATTMELKQNCAGPPAGNCLSTPIDRLTINGPASGGTVSASDSFAMGGQQASASINSSVGVTSGSSSASNQPGGSGLGCDLLTGLDCAFAMGDAIGIVGRSYVLHSNTQPDGTVVMLHLGFDFSGALAANVFNPSGLCCGNARIEVGPYVVYGPNFQINPDNFFGVFSYSLNDNATGIVTPGTLGLAVSEVGGAPVATVSGSATSTGPVGGALTLNPSGVFDVAIEATLGEAFWLGIGMTLTSNAELCESFCDATSSASGTLRYEYLNAPDGVTIGDFSSGGVLVPEPTSIALLGLGLLGLGISRRDRTA